MKCSGKIIINGVAIECTDVVLPEILDHTDPDVTMEDYYASVLVLALVAKRRLVHFTDLNDSREQRLARMN